MSKSCKILQGNSIEKTEGGRKFHPPGQNWDFFTPWTKTGVCLTPRTQNSFFLPPRTFFVVTPGQFFSNSTPLGQFFPPGQIRNFFTPTQKRVFSLPPWTKNRTFYPPRTTLFLWPPGQFCSNFTTLGHFFFLILPPSDSFFSKMLPGQKEGFPYTLDRTIPPGQKGNFPPSEKNSDNFTPSDTFSWDPPWTNKMHFFTPGQKQGFSVPTWTGRFDPWKKGNFLPPPAFLME